MPNVLTITRIQLSALQGSWAADQPVNMTTLGTLAWKHVPAAGSLNSGPRKVGTDLITLATVGDGGAYALGGGNDTFTWTDSTAGAGGANQSHIGTAQSIGNGYQITVPAPLWPDWQIMRLWDFSGNPHQVTYTASMDDADATTQKEGIGAEFNTPDYNENNNYLVSEGSYKTDVKFASDKPGKTLTVTILRNGTSMGYFGFKGAALWKAPVLSTLDRGAANGVIATGLSGPLGAF